MPTTPQLSNSPLSSALCTQEAMERPEFRKIAAVLDPTGYIRTHRKLWEWCFIADSLRRAGVLSAGHRGLGFAVGTEPLVSYFASFDAEITATDLDQSDAAAQGWLATGQHSATQLPNHYCDQDRFAQLVSYRDVDMTHIPVDLRGFDFCWSACAFEHLGSIEAGLQFVLNSLDCLNDGGVAVHTTEYNVSSNDETVEDGPTVIFRRRDIEELQRRAAQKGWILDVDFTPGTQPLDYHVDFPPYSAENHLKLRLMGHTCTSIGLAFTRK